MVVSCRGMAVSCRGMVVGWGMVVAWVGGGLELVNTDKEH